MLMSDILQLTTEEEQSLLAQCKAEFTESYQAFSPLKQKFNERKRMVTALDRWEERVADNSIASIRRTMLALYYSDELTVQVVWTNPYTWETWEDRTNIFESDFRQMDMDVWNYILQKNRFDFGVGIRYIHGWNKETSSPIRSVEHPVSRRPSTNWYLTPESFSYMAFEKTVNRNYAIEFLSKYRSKEFLERVLVGWLSPTEQQKKEWEQQHRLIQSAGNMYDTTIVYHNTLREGKPTQVCISNSCELIYAKHIDWIIEAQQSKNPQFQDTRRNISLNYFEPEEWNPFWTSLWDYCEDNQKFQNLMLELFKIKAVKQAMGWTMIIDKLAYKENRGVLESKKVWTKILAVNADSTRWVQWMATFLPEDSLSTDAYNFPKITEEKMKENIGISDQTRWLDDGKVKTKAEVLNNQQNSNINLLLWTRINSRGDKQFWSLFYLCYKYYRDESSKKLITINRWIVNTSMYYTRKDMIDYVDPIISVTNKSIVDANNQRLLDTLQLTIMQDLQNPSIPEISKRYLMRKMKRLAGNMSRHELDIIHPPSVEEMQAKKDLLLLNRNIPVKIRSMQENHIDYIIMYQLWLPTPACIAAIEMRKMAYVQSGQAAQMAQQIANQWPNQWMANSAQAQLISKSLDNTPQVNNMQ